jgi:hypothetical protein
MPLGRSILLAASRSKTLNDFALRSGFVKRATRRFMPGEHAEDALAAAAHVVATGRGVIFTQLGESITRVEAAEKVLVRRTRRLSLGAQNGNDRRSTRHYRS